VEKLDVKKKGRQQQVPDESETVGFEGMYSSFIYDSL
jgi:hypothetical protein